MDFPFVSCGPEVVCPTVFNFIGMGANVLLPFLLVLYAMRRERPFGLQSDALQSLADTKQLFRIHLQFRGSDDESEQFWQEFLVLRQRFSDGLTHGLLCIHPLLTVLYCCQAIAGVNVYSRFWFWVWTSFGLHILLLCKFPWLHWWRNVPVTYILGTLHMCAFILPMDGLSKQQILLSNATCMMGIILVAPSGGLTVSFLGSLFYSGVAMYSYANAAGEAYFDVPAYIWWQCSIGFGVMALGSCLNVLYLSNTVLAGIRRKAELAEREAVSSLLSLVCDAVVELDSDGAILSQADRLYNILLMNAKASASSLPCGVHLHNFLFSPEDRQIFEDQMQKVSTTKNAEVRHMAMRDSMGSMVKMEVFLLTFTKNGSNRYLIGIKECADGEQPAPMEESKDLADLHELSSSQTGTCRTSRISRTRSRPSYEDAEVSSEHSVRSERSHRSRAEERFLEGTMTTTSRAMDVSLAITMSTWRLPNHRNPAGGPSCCSFHTANAVLRRANRRFQTRPCIRSFHSGDQCPACGIANSMCPHTGECQICAGIEVLYPALREDPWDASSQPSRDHRRSRAGREREDDSSRHSIKAHESDRLAL